MISVSTARHEDKGTQGAKIVSCMNSYLRPASFKMVENQWNLYRCRYLDNDIFQPSKMELVEHF